MNSEVTWQSISRLPAQLERKNTKYMTVSPKENIFGLVHAGKEGVLAAAHAREASGSEGMGKTVRIHAEP